MSQKKLIRKGSNFVFIHAKIVAEHKDSYILGFELNSLRLVLPKSTVISIEHQPWSYNENLNSLIKAKDSIYNKEYELVKKINLAAQKLVLEQDSITVENNFRKTFIKFCKQQDLEYSWFPIQMDGPKILEIKNSKDKTLVKLTQDDIGYWYIVEWSLSNLIQHYEKADLRSTKLEFFILIWLSLAISHGWKIPQKFKQYLVE